MLLDLGQFEPDNALYEQSEEEQRLRLAVLQAQWERRFKTFIKYTAVAFVILAILHGLAR